jgi:hypothetical protein
MTYFKFETSQKRPIKYGRIEQCVLSISSGTSTLSMYVEYNQIDQEYTLKVKQFSP